MKTRLGFVSNSSSSSFVVIANNIANNIDGFPKEIVLGEDGVTEFGWEFTTHNDFYSKLNFAVLQTTYSPRNGKKWYDMIQSVLRSEGIEIIGNKMSDEYSLTANPDFIYSYIDHQSNAGDGANTEIFDDEDTLRRFIFSKDSYIEQGNDNV